MAPSSWMDESVTAGSGVGSGVAVKNTMGPGVAAGAGVAVGAGVSAMAADMDSAARSSSAANFFMERIMENLLRGGRPRKICLTASFFPENGWPIRLPELFSQILPSEYQASHSSASLTVSSASTPSMT